MKEITISIPAVDEAAIGKLEQLKTEAHLSELAAVRALRATYSHLARHNGYVRIGFESRTGSDCERSYYYEPNNKRTRALLTVDSFSKDAESDFTGSFGGYRLYLTEHDDWLELTRKGAYSSEDGNLSYWCCRDNVLRMAELGPEEVGTIRVLSDEQVASEYDLTDIVEGIAKSLKTLVEKLPSRYSKLRQRMALADKLVDALK
jgi:hypothetical protein